MQPARTCCGAQELGTSGNLDGQQRLIVKGRFLPKGFENVIRRYMNECAHLRLPTFESSGFSQHVLARFIVLKQLFMTTHRLEAAACWSKYFASRCLAVRVLLCRYVLCASCKSSDTLLDRDAGTRIMFLRCQQCSASRTVAPIKAGE